MYQESDRATGLLHDEQRGRLVRAFLGTHLIRSAARFLPNCHIRHRLPSNSRVAALTFEDGPHPDSTCELLSLLKEWKLPATFFLVGEQAARYPQLVAEIVRCGHAVGNHTYHHADTWRLTMREAIREIRDCSRVLDAATGKLPTWWRPPYGHVTNRLVDWCQRQGLQTALWDVLAADGSSHGSIRAVEKSLERQIRPGSIISLKDDPRTIARTAGALRNSLPRLLEHGWRFECLDVDRDARFPRS